MGFPPQNPLAGASFLLSVCEDWQLPPDAGFEVAFAGRSNAGKSTALNALAGHKALARVSRTPGRTQCLNVFTLDHERRLVDLPGYGYAKVPLPLKEQWGRLLTDYLEERECLSGIVLVMDCRHVFTELDRTLLDWAKSRARRVLTLLTKVDKLGHGAAVTALRQAEHELAGAPGMSVQLFSGLRGTGVAQARAWIAETLEMPQEK